MKTNQEKRDKEKNLKLLNEEYDIDFDELRIDKDVSTGGLRVAYKLEQAINYLYPILTTKSVQHKVICNRTLEALLDTYSLIHMAAKGTGLAKIYEADGKLNYTKGLLRLLCRPKRKILTTKQLTVSTGFLSEVGKILNAWRKNRQIKQSKSKQKDSVPKTENNADS